MRNTKTIILRAAGGFLLAGGLCILSTTISVAAQSATTTKSTATKTTSKSSGAAKQTASAKPTGAAQTKIAVTPVKASSSGKSTKKKPGTSRTARARMQTAPTADRIKEIQAALAASDAYKGEPNGKWDDASVAAMKHFQQVNGLNPSGKLDALSLEKLGLGSDTAGRGAPRVAKPPAAATSSTNPPIQR